MAKLNRIHRKLDWNLRRQERLFQSKIKQWLDIVVAEARKQFAKLSKSSRPRPKMEEELDWRWVESEGHRILKPPTLSIYLTGKKVAYESLGLSASFDVLEVGAIKAAEKICAGFVKEVSDETKKAIRVHIAAGIEEGLSNQEIAKELKEIVGLTSRQAESIFNYQKWLKEKYPDMGYKDLRSKVTQYRTLTYNNRLETIARTETARAQTKGYVEGLDGLGINKFEFSPYPGCCEACADKDGDEYKSEIAQDVIPVHPNCRCCLLPVVAGKALD